ncbi:MAG: restriction endonuclease subunit S [Paludibacter sp.]
MKSNYKPLGNYIQPVDERNANLLDLPLMGLSVSKVFFPTIANLVGTDMRTYKIVYKNQFTYIADTSRRGDKIAIALNNQFDKMLVSQAYTPFEVKDINELDPEYLMMWFRRPEFDRYARFKSHGSAREIFGWEEMCNTLLPIPHITKQREIVKEYKVIQNRITLNQQLIQKLEETAQAIYKQWFVDEVDDKWKKTEIKKYGNVVTGKTPSSEYPEDFGNDMPFVTPGDFKNYNKFALEAERNLSVTGFSKLKNKILTKGTIIITCIGSDMGKVAVSFKDCITNQQMNSIVVHKSYYSDYLYYYLQSVAEELKGIAMGGSTMPMLSKSDFEKIEIIKPSDDKLLKFEKAMKPINEMSIQYSKENHKLTDLKSLLLSKLATTQTN